MFLGAGSTEDHNEIGAQGGWRRETAEVEEGESIETDGEGEVGEEWLEDWWWI